MSLDQTIARDLGKIGVRNSVAAPGTRFGWPDVLRAIPDDEGRQTLVSGLRAVGCTPDTFSGIRAARVAVLEALVRIEDRHELSRRRVDLSELRALRRSLEMGLWP
jgi:hypothetical protein